MLPIAIFQSAPADGPGYFATYLERHSLPWRLIGCDSAALPAAAGGFSGLAFMGGPMSVNDPLPWIPRVLGLIANAIDNRVPVLGHCLGGQLLSKALGGIVTRSPVKEIGWSEVEIADNAEARRWFGAERRSFHAFEWHEDAYTLPEGATRILSNRHCVNQGFAIGNHLGLQCHIEMDESLVDSWCTSGADEIARSGGPAVQAAAEIRRDAAARLGDLHVIADGVYDCWVGGLRR